MSVVKRLISILLPFWLGEKRVLACLLVTAIVGLSAAENYLYYIASNAGNYMMTALSERNSKIFSTEVLNVFLAGFSAYAVRNIGTYVSEILNIRWREWLTTHFMSLYLENLAFYNLNQQRSQNLVDNPDERISEDIHEFTKEFLFLFNLIVGETMSLITQCFILWKVFPILVFAVIGSALVSTFGTVLVGGKLELKDLNFRQRKKEADFRFSLIRLRTFAEQIALYSAQTLEKSTLYKRFAFLIQNNLKLIRNTALYGMWKGFYERFALLVPTIILGPQVLSGKLKLGDLTQAQTAYYIAHAGFSAFTLLYEKLAAFAAIAERLIVLYEKISEKNEPGDSIRIFEGEELAVESLSYFGGESDCVLVKDLSFRLKEGSSLAIVGKTGSGKSTLLRVISGISRRGSGIVHRPPLSKIMFLPQKTYMTAGTIREQLAFPSSPDRFSNEEINSALCSVNLEKEVASQGGLDINLHWEDVLSPGQQQLLSIGRVLLHKPQIVFLDEPVSALDSEHQALVYDLIQGLGVCYVSVCHSEVQTAKHECVLELHGDSDWTLSASKSQ